MLIDKERIKDRFDFYSKNMWAEDLVPNIQQIIDEEPIVDAIPVCWIKARWAKGWLPDSERCVCENWLIEDWEKEQGAKSV